VIHKN